jgi:hypothetical protein
MVRKMTLASGETADFSIEVYESGDAVTKRLETL